jgi:hypothetical protein
MIFCWSGQTQEGRSHRKPDKTGTFPENIEFEGICMVFPVALK